MVAKYRSGLNFTAVIIGSITLLLVLGVANGKDQPDDKKNVRTHGILHCELEPSVCARICGLASPVCEVTGHCSCRQATHPKGIQCKEPDDFQAKRCHQKLCLSSKSRHPLVCDVGKEQKVCACFPDSGKTQ